MRLERADYPPAHSSSHIACSWSVSALSHSPSSFPLSFTLSFSPMWFFTSLPLIPHHPISTKFRFREILSRHLRVSISLLILCRDPEDVIASAPPIISLCFFSLPFPSHPRIHSPHPSSPSPTPFSTRKRKKETHLIKTCPKTPPSCPSGDFSSAPLN